jgi:hypothetical protein
MNTNENHRARQETRDQHQSSRPAYGTTYGPSPIRRSSLHPVQEPQNVPPLHPKRATQAKYRMPKARALALVKVFKRWIVMTSLVGFLSLSGLAALHRTGTTATSSTHIASATTTTTKKVATATATATAKPITTAKATTKTTKKKKSVQATATPSPTLSGYGFGSSASTPVTTSNVS